MKANSAENTFVFSRDLTHSLGKSAFKNHIGFNSRQPKEALHLYEEQKHRWLMEDAVNNLAQQMDIHSREIESRISYLSSQIGDANSRLIDIELLTFLNYVK